VPLHSKTILRFLKVSQNPQRLIEVAYKAGGREKSPYHFEKARAYRDLSVLFASEMEEISSKIFAIKSMNSASKSIEGLGGVRQTFGTRATP